jgi:hypothetical protein
MSELLFFIAGVVLGAVASWLITHWYYLKASADQKRELEQLRTELRPKNTLQDFERYLSEGRWENHTIEGTETWVCQNDNTFQIRKGDRNRDFSERWTTVYPDSHSGAAYPVYLLINNVVIKELTFISMDGGRIFVPMAGLRPTSGEGVEYFWNLGSLEAKVCRVIGSYYIYKDLEGVARTSRVSLIEQ